VGQNLATGVARDIQGGKTNIGTRYPRFQSGPSSPRHNMDLKR